jgi:hypothetical protein
LATAAVACLVVAAASPDVLAAAETVALYAAASGCALAIDWSLEGLEVREEDNWAWSGIATAICALVLAANQWLWDGWLAWVVALGAFAGGCWIAWRFRDRWLRVRGRRWKVVAALVLVPALFAGVSRMPAAMKTIASFETGVVLGVAGYAIAVVLAVALREERSRDPESYPMWPAWRPLVLLLSIGVGVADALGLGPVWTAVQLAVVTLLIATVFALRARGLRSLTRTRSDGP